MIQKQLKVQNAKFKIVEWGKRAKATRGWVNCERISGESARRMADRAKKGFNVG
jgi:RNA 3'-terminal phosphate cyclase